MLKWIREEWLLFRAKRLIRRLPPQLRELAFAMARDKRRELDSRANR